MAKMLLTMFVALALLLVAVSFFSVEGLLDTATGDASLTGRTNLWELVIEHVVDSPLLGVGYQSFWVVNGEASALSVFDGWVGQAQQAHNGYLDVVLQMGFVGLAAVVLFLAAPLVDSNRIGDSDFGITATYYSLWAYGLLVNFVESSIAKTDHIVWVYVMIAVFGLRQIAGGAGHSTSNVVVSVRSSQV